MEPNYNIYNDEDSILPYDFDEYDEPFFRRKNRADEEEIGDDPADYYDIFPHILSSESKYYPASWR